MANNKTHNDETMSEEVAQNPGLRSAAVNTDPSISLEEARNAAAGEGPSAAGGPAPSTAEEYIPSSSDSDPSNIPSTDHPLPDESDNPDEATPGASQSGSNEADGRYVH